MSTPDPKPASDAEFEFAPFGIHRESAGRTIDIGRFLLSLWRPLTLGLFVGLLVGVGAYLWMGPVYQASTQVLVSKKATVPAADRDANRYGDRGEHVQLLKTDLIIERAFKDHGLDEVPELANAYDPLKEVSEGLLVSRSAGQESSFDNVLDIGFQHGDKSVAKKVVQAIVDAYRDYLYDTRDDNARELYQTLLSRQDALMKEIAKLEQEYHQFRQDSPVFLKASPIVTVNGQPAPAQNQYETELAALEAAQNQNQIKRSSIVARLAELDRKILQKTPREALEFWVMHSLSTGTSSGSGAGSAGSTVAATASPEKSNLDQQLLTARLLEQNLLHTLGEQHLQVRNVRRQIDTILDFYRRQGLTPPNLDSNSNGAISSRSASLGVDLVSVYRETLEGQLRELDIEDKNLAALHEEAEAKAKKATMFEVEDQRRKDEIALKKEQLDRLFQQIAAYDITKEQEGYRLQQIARVRVERSLKQLIKLVGTCGILGMALVFCLAYFREWYDNSLKSLDEIRQLSRQQLLGAVPTFHQSADADRLAEERGVMSQVCYLLRPGSREAEAYRSVRTSLFVALDDGQQIVQFSSPEPGDGKSTTVANLAVALAQSGKRVLLIDADLRRPTLHQIFKTRQEAGLADVLHGEIAWENALRSTPVPELSLLTAGDCPENPAELLATASLGTLLKAMRTEFDYILIDSPPILAVSDPCIIAPQTDGMVLVVRLQKTSRTALRRMQETLTAHGVRSVGVVANDLHQDGASDAGYDYDSFQAYYNTENAAAKGSAKSHRTPAATP